MGKTVRVDGLAISDVYMPIVTTGSLLLHCSVCGRVVVVTSEVIQCVMGIAIERQASVADMLGEYANCCDRPDVRGQFVTLISKDNTPPQDVMNGNEGHHGHTHEI